MQKYERPHTVAYRIANDYSAQHDEENEFQNRQKFPMKGALALVFFLLLVVVVALVVAVKNQEQLLVATTSAALRGDQTAQIADQPSPRHVHLTSESLYLTRSSVLCETTRQPNGSSEIGQKEETWKTVTIIAIDCENTGTNLHIFSFLQCCQTESGKKLQLTGEVFHHSDHSLLEYAHRPNLVEQLISSLLEKASSSIAEDKKASTPLIVRAPTEMRHVSPYVTAKILSRVKKTAMRMGYQVGKDSLKVMKPGDKAADLWIATSFLTANSFAGKSPEELVVVELGEQDLRVARVLKRKDTKPKPGSARSKVSPKNKSKKKRQKEIKIEPVQRWPETQGENYDLQLIMPNIAPISAQDLEVRESTEEPLVTTKKPKEVTNEVSPSLSVPLNEATFEEDKSRRINRNLSGEPSELESHKSMDLQSLLKEIFWGENSALYLLAPSEDNPSKNIRHKRRLSENVLEKTLFEPVQRTDLQQINFQDNAKQMLYEWEKMMEETNYSTDGEAVLTSSKSGDKTNHQLEDGQRSCLHSKKELCMESIPSDDRNCRNLLNTLSTALNALLCIFRVTDHIEICNIISDLCQHLSKESITDINKKLDRMNRFGNKLHRVSTRRSMRTKLNRVKFVGEPVENLRISRFYSRFSKDTIEFARQEPNVAPEDAFRRQEESHLNRRRGRRRVEDELMVQIAPRCMSQHQYTLSASSLPFGVYPARIAFLTYRLSIAEQTDKLPTKNWAKGTRSDVSPEEVYGMTFFDAMGEQGLNSSDSYNLGGRQMTSSSVPGSPFNISGTSGEALTPTHREGDNSDDSRGNLDGQRKVDSANESFQDSSRHGVNYIAATNIIEKDHHSMRNFTGKTNRHVGNRQGKNTSNTNESGQSELQMIEDLQIQADLKANNSSENNVSLENDSPGKIADLTKEKYERGAPELGRGKNRERKMQMDRRWMAETVAKLNRVVDSILRSIATGDIRVVEKQSEGADKNESALVKNEVGSGSIGTPTPSLSLELSNSTSIGGNNGGDGRKPRKRRLKKKRKQSSRRRAPGRKRKKCDGCTHRQSVHSNRTVDAEELKASARTISDRNRVQTETGLRTSKRRVRTKRRVSEPTTSAKDVVSLRSPCLPRGSKGRLTLEGQEVTIIGSFNERHKQRCRSQVRELALSRINKAISGPDSEVVLTGAFYYIADSVGLMNGREGGRIKAGTFRKIAARVCASPFYEDPLACFDYQWAASIILHGLKIPPSQRVKVGETVNGIRITSALGSVINYLETN